MTNTPALNRLLFGFYVLAKLLIGVAQTKQEVPALLQKLRGEIDQLDAAEQAIARLS